MRFGALGTVGRGPRHRRSWWRVGCGCRQGCQVRALAWADGFMMTSVALLLQAVGWEESGDSVPRTPWDFTLWTCSGRCRPLGWWATRGRHALQFARLQRVLEVRSR